MRLVVISSSDVWGRVVMERACPRAGNGAAFIAFGLGGSVDFVVDVDGTFLVVFMGLPSWFGGVRMGGRISARRSLGSWECSQQVHAGNDADRELLIIGHDH